MKKIVLLSMMLSLCCIMDISAQTKKEQKNAAKELKQQVNALVADGWRVSPGQLSLSEQQKRANAIQKEMDDEGFPKFISGSAQSIGNNYDAAKMQALEFAKQDAARKIQSEVAGIVENDLANVQLSPGEAESTAKTILAGKSTFYQKLGRAIVLMECYRVLPNKNTEVMMVVAYDYKKTMSLLTSEIKKEIDARGKKLHEEVDKIL